MSDDASSAHPCICRQCALRSRSLSTRPAPSPARSCRPDGPAVVLPSPASTRSRTRVTPVERTVRTAAAASAAAARRTVARVAHRRVQGVEDVCVWVEDGGGRREQAARREEGCEPRRRWVGLPARDHNERTTSAHVYDSVSDMIALLLDRSMHLVRSLSDAEIEFGRVDAAQQRIDLARIGWRRHASNGRAAIACPPSHADGVSLFARSVASVGARCLPGDWPGRTRAVAESPSRE
jgi:hypothetical protein